MKNNIMLLALLLFCLLPFVHPATDTCPSGMRKTYVDETNTGVQGSARQVPLSIAFYEGNGAVLVSRKVLMKPRFEVHLKVSVDPVEIIEDSSEQQMDGFTIVLSPNKIETAMTASSEHLGYSGLQNVYVMEFDFNKHSYDIAADSYSFKYCDASGCSGDDSRNNVIKQGEIKNQKYVPTKGMNWDFRLIYKDGNLVVTSGASEELVNVNVNLEDKFESYVGYIGFTGYLKGNRRELGMLGTFFCEDVFDMNKMSGKFYVNSKEYETYEYASGADMKYLLTFRNSEGNLVPHCWGLGVFSFVLKLDVKCAASASTKLSDEYTLVLSTKACEEAGKYAISAFADGYGKSSENYFTVKAGGCSKVVFKGHDGTGQWVGKLDGSYFWIQHGTGQNGNFQLSTSLKIVLDFYTYDSHGNLVDLGTTDSSTIISKLGFSYANANGAKMSAQKTGDHYQLILTPTKIGEYTINKSNYMEYGLKFKVTSGGVSNVMSSCGIDGYTSTPTLEQGKQIVLKCTFKDELGNVVSSEVFQRTYEFSCVLRQTSPVSKTTTIPYEFKNGQYTCPTTVTGTGSYTIVPYINLIGSTYKMELSGVVKSYKTIPVPSTIVNSKILNMNGNNWVNIKDATLTYKASSTGKVTCVDMVEQDQKTLMSVAGKYPDNFKVSDMIAKVTNSHDSSLNFDLKPEVETINNKQYICLYTPKKDTTENYIKKTSYQYVITITYSGVSYLVNLKYNVNCSGYTTCNHAYDASKTTVVLNGQGTYKLVKGGNEIEIGKIELRTSDGNLYNYSKDLSIISSTLGSDKGITFRYQKSNIEGVYKIYAKATEAFTEQSFQFIVDGKKIATTGKISSTTAQACLLSLNEENKFDRNDKTFRLKDDAKTFSFSFYLYDSQGNAVTESDIGKAGLTITSNDSGAKYKLTYNSNSRMYTFTEDGVTGEVEWTFSTICSGSGYKYKFSYGRYGFAQNSFGENGYSYYSVSSGNIGVGSYSYIELNLRDTYDKNLGRIEGKLEELKGKCSVKATRTSLDGKETDKPITIPFSEITTSTIKYGAQFTERGVYEIEVICDGQIIKGNSKITVNYEEVNFWNSHLFMITDKQEQIYHWINTNIDNNKQTPRFIYELCNNGGKVVKEYDQSIIVTAYLEKSGSETYDFKVTKNVNGQFEIVYDGKKDFNKLTGGSYILHLISGYNEVRYPLILKGEEGSEDASNYDEYQIDKTSISRTEINGIVGEVEILSIQFNCKDGLRFNQPIDVNKIKITDSKGLISKNNFKYTVKHGLKDGQIVIEMIQYEAIEKNQLTIEYEGNILNKNKIIYFSTKSGGFTSLKLVDGTCKKGNMDELTVLRFEAIDHKGNRITDLSSFTQEMLNGLFSAKSDIKTTMKVYTTADGYIEVRFKPLVPTDITVTSDYWKDSCKYHISSGALYVDTLYSEARVTAEKDEGTEYTMVIIPTDQYGNELENLDESIVKDFEITYVMNEGTENEKKGEGKIECGLVYTPSSQIYVNDQKTMEDEGSPNSITCKTLVQEVGSIHFYTKYKDKEIECHSCLTSVYSNKLDIEKTTVNYKGEEISTTTETKIDNTEIPSFNVVFHDQYGNVITTSDITENIKVVGSIEGTDIKMCVKQNGADKVITICPSSNGDDNYNKWQYLVNGEYKLIVEIDGRKIVYDIEINGKYTGGSSGKIDLSKTHFDSNNVEMTAGEYKTVTFELRTKDGERKNYWYPDINVIKVDYEKDSNCTTPLIQRGNLPGQYNIKYLCYNVIEENKLIVSIDGTQTGVDFSVVTNTGCLLTVTSEPPKSLTNDDSVSFDFTLTDSFGNPIIVSDISKLGVDVSSTATGKEKEFYSITSKGDGKYTFTEKITTYVPENTWHLTPPCGKGGYTYIYKKNPGAVVPSKSFFYVKNTEIIVKEISYVNIILKDKLGVDVGITKEVLEGAKKNLKIEGKNAEGDKVEYELDSASGITITYRAVVPRPGKYVVTTMYGSTSIPAQEKDKQPLDKFSAIYQGYDINHNKMFKVENDKVTMSTETQTNIDNVNEYPHFLYELYNEGGEKIKEYDEKMTYSCTMMTMINGQEYIWKFVASLSADGITCLPDFPSEEFKSLPTGNYKLELKLDENIIDYPLYIIGDSESGDASPSSRYDITKTYFSTAKISGIAGETYEIKLEFRATDGLRWNYEGNMNDFTFINSYGLTSPTLKTIVKQGEKKGQFIISVMQNKATTGQNDNELTISYHGEKLPVKVYVEMRAGDIAKLVYEDGLRDGTVEDLPSICYKAYDKYGNEIDLSSYTTKQLNELTGYDSSNGSLTPNNSYDGKCLNVQYKTEKPTNVTVYSSYMEKKYEYEITSGNIDVENSSFEVKGNGVAGGEYVITIDSKDIYGNPVDDLTQEEIDDFTVFYDVVNINGEEYHETIDKRLCVVNKNRKYQCTIKVPQAGDVEFHVDYDKKEIINCNGCKTQIKAGEVDFTKTTVEYINKEQILDEEKPNNVDIGSKPEFEIILHDVYGNEITDKDIISEYKVETILDKTDVKLCTGEKNGKKIATVCATENGDDNENKWTYLTNGDNYKLIIDNGEIKKDYKIELSGGFTDGSSGRIDIKQTTFNPYQTTITAGKDGSVLMELKAEDGLRKNYWFDKPEDHIKVTCERDETCNIWTTQASKPGQYNINFNCEKADNLKTCNVKIDEEEVIQPIHVTIKPGKFDHSKLFTMDDKEITTQNLGTVVAGETYQLKQVIYDKYDNIIPPGEIPVDKTMYKFVPYAPKNAGNYGNSFKTDSKQVNFTLTSEIGGDNQFYSDMFPLKAYNLTVIPGKVNASNSEVIVPKKDATVGESSKVYVVPYDDYGNQIDASIFKGDDNPFVVTYTVNGETKTETISGSDIEEYNGMNVISYEPTFTKTGTNTITAAIDGTPAQCVSCIINTKSGGMVFENSVVKELDSGYNLIEVKNGTKEDNKNENPTFRLYPRDEFGNVVDIIPKDELNELQAYITNNEGVKYDLRLNNKDQDDQSYAEFVKDDSIQDSKTITYDTLVGGNYDLVFTDGEGTIKYNITLLGDNNDTDASNLEVDNQKTRINEEKLDFIAGEQGVMYVELRTIDDKRKNFWGDYDEKIEVKSCDSKDDSFDYTVKPAGTLGVFEVTVTTEKANTYPTLEKCPLKVFVDGEEVKGLNPEITVRPNIIDRTEIVEEYMSNEKNTLKPGNADDTYTFEVKSFDKYNNLVETDQDTVKIKVTDKNGEEMELNTGRVTETGYQKYTLNPTETGTYYISSANNDKTGEKYLRNNQKFVINPGEIYPGNTRVYEVRKEIKAGEKPQVMIESFDKNGNQIPGNEFTDKYEVTLIDSNGNSYPATAKIDENPNQVIYTTKDPVTVVGPVTAHVVYKPTEEIIPNDVSINVSPNDPVPENSILSKVNSLGAETKYKPGEVIHETTQELPEYKVTLYDEFGNKVNEIPKGTTITNIVLQGNDMTPIDMDVREGKDEFKFDFKEDDNDVDQYTHLVSGDNYELSYKVTIGNEEKVFKYPVTISSGKNDEGHGNGPYSPENCYVEPNEATFYAGEYESTRLYINTASGLLYNNEIDIEKIGIEVENKEDKSFKYTVEKDGSEYGIFKITVYSEKKGDNKITVTIPDEKGEAKEAGEFKFHVLPLKTPDPQFTEIIEKPKDETKDNEFIDLEFKLADKFNNTFEDREDIIDDHLLSVLNNGDNITNSASTPTLGPDGETYHITFPPLYPPRDMSINVVYGDGNENILTFPEDVKTKIISEPDFTQTEITGRNIAEIDVGDTLDMHISIFDSKGYCIDKDYSENLKIEVTGPLELGNDLKKYDVKKPENTDLECNNLYDIITGPGDEYTKSGTYNIKVYANGDPIAEYKQICHPLNVTEEGFLLDHPEGFDPDHVPISDPIEFQITAEDIYGNPTDKPLKDDLEFTLTIDGEEVPIEVETTEDEVGIVDVEIDCKKVGDAQLHIKYKDVDVPTVNHGEPLPIYHLETGGCTPVTKTEFYLDKLNDTMVNEPTDFTIQCFDIYGNKIDHGGDPVTSIGYLVIDDTQTSIETNVVDNDDGTYTIQLTPPRPGDYIIGVSVGPEKYGENVEFTISSQICGGATPYMCPHKKKCVDDLIKCVTEETGCPPSTPFKCEHGPEGCVKSQLDCNCAPGFLRCEYMRYCVPENRIDDMCLQILTTAKKCKKMKSTWIVFADGVCRTPESKRPNQIVCPYGQVLCADLSCRDSYPLCFDSPEGPCTGTTIRCVDQTCQTDNGLCPNTKVCNNDDYVVCPDGKCVPNEAYCEALPTCNDEKYPYRCANNLCVAKQSYCPKNVACGHGLMYCEDSICRRSCA